MRERSGWAFWAGKGGEDLTAPSGDRATAGVLYRIGCAGFVTGWSVAQVGDTLCATPDGGDLGDTRTTEVDSLARWAANKKLKLGWGRFPDGAEVINVNDPADGNFGYAFNVTAPRCSEWGRAPFQQRAA